MAQPAQSTPTVTANISGTRHQVNLRDYLNARVAPFLKKAITESLEASPEFPLQWLGENLIHQSMLYEGNPDSTGIKERFLYKFETPVPVAVQPAVSDDVGGRSDGGASGSGAAAATATAVAEVPVESVPAEATESASASAPAPAPVAAQDTQMANHVNGDADATLDQRENDTKDTEMAGTS